MPSRERLGDRNQNQDRRSFLSETLRLLGMRWPGQGIKRDGDRLTGIEEGFTLTPMKAFYGQKVLGF